MGDLEYNIRNGVAQQIIDKAIFVKNYRGDRESKQFYLVLVQTKNCTLKFSIF